MLSPEEIDALMELQTRQAVQRDVAEAVRAQYGIDDKVSNEEEQ